MLGGHWLLFVVLIFAPDVFMIGYLKDKKFGAHVYNLGHTYTTPLLLAGFSFLIHQQLLLSISLIWIAHIAMDRTLGYGLKLPSGFSQTHLSNFSKKSRKVKG